MAVPARRPEAHTEPALLRVEGLTVHFGEVVALEDVGLAVRPGELVALAGENGAGKSTLVRCIAGAATPSNGRITFAGRRVPPRPGTASRLGISVVWQDLALCDNLDVASNLLLGRERPFLLLSDVRFHAAARRLLDDLGIRLPETTRAVSSLSTGQRQLLAVARAMSDRPRLLILDEPTASLGVAESAQVEALIAELRRRGTTIVLVSHDVEQMFRLADRITVLRHGRVVADVEPTVAHPDDVVALIAGQQIDTSARRQLSRLGGLVDRLASADASSSMPIVLSALAAALGVERLCLHVAEGSELRLAASFGLPDPLWLAWQRVPFGPGGGPVGLVAATQRPVTEPDVTTSRTWSWSASEMAGTGIAASWSVPVIGSGGLAGVITVLRSAPGGPGRDELDLAMLYAGHAAGVVERERLLGEVTARNRVLETIREVLETLAGPTPLEEGLRVAFHALLRGLGADRAGLVIAPPQGGALACRACVDAEGSSGPPHDGGCDDLIDVATRALAMAGDNLGALPGPLTLPAADGGAHLALPLPAPGGPMTVVAYWASRPGRPDAMVLVEDVAHSIRLALERQQSELAHQETSALRRSQELQRQFLSRLSHELRTPLTAIRGYASSLMQPDVSWDGDSQQRFLSRIAAESARLGRLVGDMLDFSAIESSVLRLNPDWCDVGLVLDVAAACLLPEELARVRVEVAADLPVVWADHDRLEQVFVNLLDNALRHNPPGTSVLAEAQLDGEDGLVVTVTDDGSGLSDDPLLRTPGPPAGRRQPSAGAGLGLSIARGIVEAHGGRLVWDRPTRGTRFSVYLPLEGPRSTVRSPEEIDV